MLAIQDAVPFTFEAGASKATFTRVAVRAVCTFRAVAAFDAHSHEIVSASETRAVVEEFSDTATREVHGTHIFLAR